MMKQLSDSVTVQAATVATLSTKINGSGAGWNTVRKKARPGLHVCVHCKREMYHKDANGLELDCNKAKRCPGRKSVFIKE